MTPHIATHTRDVEATVDQIQQLAEAGCELVRVACPTEADAKDLLTFMEMILKLVFEFPNRVPGHGSPAAAGI